MANTDETYKFINDAWLAACQAQRYLDWVLDSAPNTEEFEVARTAAAVAYPHLSDAIDTLRTARVHAIKLANRD